MIGAGFSSTRRKVFGLFFDVDLCFACLCTERGTFQPMQKCTAQPVLVKIPKKLRLLCGVCAFYVVCRYLRVWSYILRLAVNFSAPKVHCRGCASSHCLYYKELKIFRERWACVQAHLAKHWNSGFCAKIWTSISCKSDLGTWSHLTHTTAWAVHDMAASLLSEHSSTVPRVSFVKENDKNLYLPCTP